MIQFMPTLSKLPDRLRSSVQNRSLRTQLHCCPDRELRRIIEDIGLRRHDLRALMTCRHPGQTELMPQWLDRVGLDAAYIKLFYTSTYQDLQRVCASCKAWRVCARDLARGDVQTGMDSYCLNAPTIDALLLDRPPWDSS